MEVFEKHSKRSLYVCLWRTCGIPCGMDEFCLSLYFSSSNMWINLQHRLMCSFLFYQTLFATNDYFTTISIWRVQIITETSNKTLLWFYGEMDERAVFRPPLHCWPMDEHCWRDKHLAHFDLNQQNFMLVTTLFSNLQYLRIFWSASANIFYDKNTISRIHNMISKVKSIKFAS